MWLSVSKPWQVAFEQAWESFINGSIPIGAVIADENENIISYGRNRLFEKLNVNPNIAHAEMEAIQKLDLSKFPNVYTYTLYTTMEPCPMCMGTFVMSNLRKLRVAARDSYCGATHYCKTDEYIASKKISVEFELGSFELVQLAMQTYFELKLRQGKMNSVTELFEKDNPLAIQIAKLLYKENRLDWHVRNKSDFNCVYDEILSNLECM